MEQEVNELPLTLAAAAVGRCLTVFLAGRGRFLASCWMAWTALLAAGWAGRELEGPGASVSCPAASVDVNGNDMSAETPNQPH